MLMGELTIEFHVLGFQIVEFLHTSTTYEEICLFLVLVVDLAYSIASSDVAVV